MTIPKMHPLAEMTLAVQFAAPQTFPPQAAVDLWNASRAEYPLLELMPRIDQLGGGEIQIFQSSELALRPRYWFASESSEFLRQMQDDLVACNWRRLVGPTEPPAVPYPGFVEMRKRFDGTMAAWLQAGKVAPDAPVGVCSLLYDNIFAMSEGAGFADIFTFWQRLGVSGRQGGPELKWTVMLEDDIAGPNARIEIIASQGQVLGERMQHAARLHMAAFGHPGTAEGVGPAFESLHRECTRFFDLLIVKETRERWDV